MILVSVGPDPFPFERLLGWIDLLLRQELVSEEVVADVGASSLQPAGAGIHRNLSEAAFVALAARARVIVADAGEASLQLLSPLSTPYILVPRSERFGEQIDEHQLELAQALAAEGVPIAWGPGDLLRFLNDPQRVPLSDLPGATAGFLCADLKRRFAAPGARPTVPWP